MIKNAVARKLTEATTIVACLAALTCLGGTGCDADSGTDGAEFRAAVDDASEVMGDLEIEANSCFDGFDICEGDACLEVLAACMPSDDAMGEIDGPWAPETRNDEPDGERPEGERPDESDRPEGERPDEGDRPDGERPKPGGERPRPIAQCIGGLLECLDAGTEPRTCVDEARACIREQMEQHFDRVCRHHLERCVNSDAPAEKCERIEARCEEGLPERPDGERPDGERPDGERPDGERPDGERPEEESEGIGGDGAAIRL